MSANHSSSRNFKCGLFVHKKVVYLLSLRKLPDFACRVVCQPTSLVQASLQLERCVRQALLPLCL